MIVMVLAANPTFSYLGPVFLWLMAWVGLEVWSSAGRKRAPADKRTG